MSKLNPFTANGTEATPASLKVIARGRLSYSHIDKPYASNGGDPKYSASLIIDKSDTKTIDAINAAVEAAVQRGVAKFGSGFEKGTLKRPLRDGDAERDDEAYSGAYFVNANSKIAPKIVDRDLQPIFDPDEVYSGCYVRLSLTFYPFSANGNKGVACGLGNVQKIKDGEHLGGRSSAEQDFATGLDDDDDFLS